MNTLKKLIKNLRTRRKTWLVTGVAGFIGSNLLEALLKANQLVVGIDNFSTGHQRNLDEVKENVGRRSWKNFTLIHADICDAKSCKRACLEIDFVLHQAAVASVFRSIENPILTHHNNVEGFVTILNAAKEAKVKRFVYASSSSVYGDHPALPKIEHSIGNCLSPYAASKRVNEIYADVFAKCYDLKCVGLRYFNVFGPRQDPNGAYAAVIPKWISAMLRSQPVHINGDGETSRDFCFVANVVQANLLAATSQNPAAQNQIYNIATGNPITLNQLFQLLQSGLSQHVPATSRSTPVYGPFRAGDIRHSHAEIAKAKELLGFNPTEDTQSGLVAAIDWYLRSHQVSHKSKNIVQS